MSAVAVNRSAERSAYRLMSTLAACIDRDSPITIALVFSRIAAAGPAGIFQNAVQRELGLTPTSMTRSLQTLADGKGPKPGLGLVAREMDFARDGRAHILKLTTKGRELANQLTESIGQNHASV